LQVESSSRYILMQLVVQQHNSFGRNTVRYKNVTGRPLRVSEPMLLFVYSGPKVHEFWCVHNG